MSQKTDWKNARKVAEFYFAKLNSALRIMMHEIEGFADVETMIRHILQGTHFQLITD